jgi:ring-1,2-phenylacetyl-CoA epoxidase subunit PaaE
MSKFQHLEVQEIRKETSDTVSISFSMKNGQSQDFEYEAGQYLTFKASINGEEVRRSYSLCSSPLENEWRIAVKKVPGGKFSTFANEVLKTGDVLEVMPPLGHFTHDLQPQDKNLYVAFAAGSGITPVISIIKTILKEEPFSSFILFYGNRHTDGIIFKEKLEALKNQYLERFSVHFILSQERQESPLFTGRIDTEKCQTYGRVFFQPKEVNQFFICGPEQMILDVKDYLLLNEVDADKIKFELFSTPTSKAFVRAQESIDHVFDPSAESLITVQIDGDTIEFPLPYSGKSILEASIDAGADAPFACKGGVCCTCKAKLIAGDANMDVVYGLEPDEIDNGYILTCQAHPRSEKLIVDFDV